jgi:uncharacterized protein YndB with AHSA1/START domain
VTTTMEVAVSTMDVYFSIAREVDAPREQVFRTWVAQRHAPHGYREVTIPRRLVFTTGPDAVAIVTFASHHEGTVVTFEGSAPADEVDAVEARWLAVLDGLADQLAGSHSRGNVGGIRPG